MASSMTGYGRAETTVDGRKITVEIKSVNHRYFEFTARVPRSCGYLEEKLKTYLQSRRSRGKTDIFVAVDTADTGIEVKINRKLADSYLQALRGLAGDTGLPDDVSLLGLARFPEIFSLEKPTEDADAVWNAVRQVTAVALDNLVAMRESEGARLCEDILHRLAVLEEMTAVIEQRSPQTVAEYRDRLFEKLSVLLADRSVDDARVLTEAAIFADRVAVAEETVRLRSHIAQYREILSGGGAVGRKLDFLTQELNREVNTIGSKAQDAQIATVVIELKSEIEKIREQIQNIE
jgi:uncharacterized protein (TIGR00255 family)